MEEEKKNNKKINNIEENESNLEEILKEVETCIEQLENPQVSLEDAFRYYEEGIKKLQQCHNKVAKLEQQMLVINSRGELQEFEKYGNEI